jgi:hypothetical protein
MRQCLLLIKNGYRSRQGTNRSTKIFPHYFERFKTDGVEHNLYIGASISSSKPFDLIYLNNLRLWQFQTLCKMELEHHNLKSALPYELDVTSLILVFSSPLQFVLEWMKNVLMLMEPITHAMKW